MDSNKLVAGMVALEDAAFQEFADRFGPRIRVLCVFCGYEPDQIEELVAECVETIALKVTECHREFPTGKLDNWVAIQARNILVRYWNQNNPDKLDFDPLFSLLRAVEKTLLQLPKTDVDIIKLLRKVGVASNEDFAKLLGVPAKEADEHCRRASRRFYAILSADPKANSLLKQLNV